MGSSRCTNFLFPFCGRGWPHHTGLLQQVQEQCDQGYLHCLLWKLSDLNFCRFVFFFLSLKLLCFHVKTEQNSKILSNFWTNQDKFYQSGLCKQVFSNTIHILLTKQTRNILCLLGNQDIFRFLVSICYCFFRQNYSDWLKNS